MKILHVCPNKSFSGLERYALQLALDQKKAQHNVHFVAAPGSRLEDECTKNQIQVLQRNLALLFFIRFFSFLRNNTDLQAIHIHNTRDMKLLAPVLLLLKIFRPIRAKVILQLHMWIDHNKQDFFHKVLYSILDEVWCSSHLAREALLKVLPVAPEKYRIVHYGRPVSQMKAEFLSREEARSRLQIAESDIVFVCINRIEKMKGIRELIEASLPILQEKNIRLFIIGGPTHGERASEIYHQEMLDFIQQQSADIQSRIHFKGHIENVHTILKAFDVFVLPSYKETFSLAVLDAQLAGLPVIGTDEGGTPEQVIPEKTGWLCRTQSANSLQLMMIHALSEKNLWATYGKIASERIEKEFNSELISQKIMARY